MNEYTTTTPQGTKLYYKDKEKTIIHREDGPAIEYGDGTKSWVLNDKYHRMDGPAIEYANGRRMWYINNVFIFEISERGDIYKKPQR